MYFIGIFFVELIFLFVLSRFVTSGISNLVYRATGSYKFGIYALSFLFLPGTIIHELSHFLVAQILFVRTGEMEFVPKVYEDRVKLGSVQIEKSDPFRRALIGVAPFLLGTSLLIIILFSAEFYNVWSNIWLVILVIYLLFEIGNTMFSSSKDMEGVLELFAVIIILALVLFFAGTRLPVGFFTFFSSLPVINIFQKGSYFLAIPVIIDLIFIGINKLFLRVVR